MGSFRDLRAWQEGIALSKAIYVATDAFPRSEERGLTSQLRRAATSVPTNVAEASGRYGPKDQGRFYRIALGSARELESLIVLSGELGLLGRSAAEALGRHCRQVQQLIRGLIRE
jgi:four helix bundle protein